MDYLKKFKYYNYIKYCQLYIKFQNSFIYKTNNNLQEKLFFIFNNI